MWFRLKGGALPPHTAKNPFNQSYSTTIRRAPAGRLWPSITLGLFCIAIPVQRLITNYLIRLIEANRAAVLATALYLSTAYWFWLICRMLGKSNRQSLRACKSDSNERQRKIDYLRQSGHTIPAKIGNSKRNS